MRRQNERTSWRVHRVRYVCSSGIHGDVLYEEIGNAQVAKLVDALALEASARKGVSVRVRPWAPLINFGAIS